MRLGLITCACEEERVCWGQVERLLSESLQPLPAIWREDFRHGKPVVTVMQSHHNLPEVFRYLWGAPSRESNHSEEADVGLASRGSFVDHVLRLVLFHHSL